MTRDPDPSLADLAALLNARFDAIDARFDFIDNHLASHSESIAWLKMNVGMLSQALAGVAASVEQCKLELARRDVRMEQVEADVARLSDSVEVPEGSA